MKATITVLAMLVAMSQARAQSIQYDEATNTVVETKTVTNTPTVVLAPAPQAAPVIVQAAPAPAAAPATATAAITVVTPTSIAAPVTSSVTSPVTAQVVQQPTTVIEETPVKDSRSELLKKARGQMEDHTERKIEEKLEEARIRDEKKRSDRFEGAIESSENQQVAPVPAAPVALQAAPFGVAAPTTEVVQPVAPVIVAPNAQAVIVPAAKDEVKVEKKEEVKIESNDDVRPVVREELRSDMDRKEVKKDDKQEFYIGALGGLADYPGATNVKANGQAGFEVGFITKNRIVIEGAFAYSSFDLQEVSGLYSQYPPYKNLSQYNTTLALKYQILPGTFRPYAGILAGYTQRNYTQPSNMVNYAPGTTQDASSSAIDYGFTAGLDVQVASNLLIGVDFKYLTNLSNHVDDAYQRSYNNAQYVHGTTPVEELDYYSAGITAKLVF